MNDSNLFVAALKMLGYIILGIVLAAVGIALVNVITSFVGG